MCRRFLIKLHIIACLWKWLSICYVPSDGCQYVMCQVMVVSMLCTKWGAWYITYRHAFSHASVVYKFITVLLASYTHTFLCFRMVIWHVQLINTSYSCKFSTIILSVFYIVSYIVNHVFRTEYFIFVHWFDCIFNTYFIKTPSWGWQQWVAETCRRFTMIKI